MNLINKVGDTVATTLSTADPPVILETPVVAIGIAVTDPANSTGKMQAGSVAISLEDNEGLSGRVPQQICRHAFQN